MDGLTREDSVRNVELRLGRIEQFLPTLATKGELQAAVATLATKDEMQSELQAAVAKLATKDEMRAEIRAGDIETRHYMKILVEDLRGDIKILGEGLSAMNARHARDYAELVQTDAGLDRRVTALEAGHRRARSR